ncbi:hypothetical protein CLV92_103263 [Kineococcus xinjiangensis]|uniref:Uncharacterized protein n=1 Tax=Kineococcus xinjiangensis TaxID=512762 RepID=A0A2S6IU32_9ACTN|nr:hypothetical protein [Kineococcus xinjiangensis]PPK97728.1 hypothetical protein CLV92_103263 [Kineococcus xinjiangensis]
MSQNSDAPTGTTPSDDTVDVFDNAEVRQVQDQGSRENARASNSGPLPAPARDPQDPFGQQDDVADGTGQGDPTAGVRISDEDLQDAVPGDDGPAHPGTR